MSEAYQNAQRFYRRKPPMGRSLYSSAQNEELQRYVGDTEYKRSLAVGRTLHPQLGALTEDEFGTLRIIQQNYDKGKIYENYFKDPEDKKSLKSLQKLGFIRLTSTGRIIPNYIAQEHEENEESEPQTFGSESKRLNKAKYKFDSKPKVKTPNRNRLLA